MGFCHSSQPLCARVLRGGVQVRPSSTYVWEELDRAPRDSTQARRNDSTNRVDTLLVRDSYVSNEYYEQAAIGESTGGHHRVG